MLKRLSNSEVINIKEKLSIEQLALQYKSTVLNLPNIYSFIKMLWRCYRRGASVVLEECVGMATATGVQSSTLILSWSLLRRRSRVCRTSYIGTLITWFTIGFRMIVTITTCVVPTPMRWRMWSSRTRWWMRWRWYWLTWGIRYWRWQLRNCFISW